MMRRFAAGLVLAAAVAGVGGGVAAAVQPGPLPAPPAATTATTATSPTVPSPAATVAPRPGSGQMVPVAPPAATTAPVAPSPTGPVGRAPGPLQPTAAQTLAPTIAPNPPASTAPFVPPTARPGQGYGPGSTTAGATDGGMLGDVCRKAPEAEIPGRSALDVVDFGQASGSGLYARYRYAGWGSHLYNPGCADAMIKALADKAGGSIGMVGNAITEEGGANKTTNIILAGARIGIAVTVAATRVAFGEYPVWAIADQISDAARVTFGGAVLAAFLGAGIAVSMIWLATRRRLDMAGFTGALWRVAGIAALGLLLIGWQGTVGRSYDDAAAATHRAATAAVTSDTSGATQAGDVVGDALMSSVYMPLWGAVHLGWDRDAIGKYAERLHAASALTVDEARRVEGSSAELATLMAAKQRDYDAVAAEIKAANPAAYRQLEGKDAGARPPFAALLLLAVLPILVIVGFTSFVVLAARLVVRLGTGVYPVLVAALQFPSLHRWGLGIPKAVLRWGAYGLVATVASVVVHRVLIVAALADGAGSVFERIAALTFVNVGLIIGWVYRDQLAEKVGASKEYDAATAAIKDLADRIDKATKEPRSKLAKKSHEFRHGRRPSEQAKPEQAPAVAGPSAKTGAAVAVRRATKARVAKAGVAKAAAAAAPPQLRAPAKAVAAAAGRGK